MLLAKTLRSTTFRLALACIAIFGAMVIALFAYIYVSTSSFVRTRSDPAIAAAMDSLQGSHAAGGREGLIAAIKQRLADPRFAEDTYLVTDASFAPLAGNLPRWPPSLAGAAGWDEVGAGDGGPTLRVRFETLPDGAHLLVGRAVGELDAFARKIGGAMAATIALVFLLAGLASVMVTRRTVGRIEAINATSRAIMRSGLDRRIPRRETHDEWDELASNLNTMLDRIEALMGEVREVADNVAHDLRTPLARMRGRLEKAYRTDRDAVSDQALIGQTLADLETVLRMFSSVMRISQIEAYDAKAGFRPIDLTEVAGEVVELFDAAAEEKGSRLERHGQRGALAIGDRDLLFEALANLVDNAIKHGRAGGHVTVTVTDGGAGAAVAVADDGPGIPAGEYQNVFRRFYRLEQSRCTTGNGLGLSLVEAVARLHGARIDMRDTAPGLEVRLHFPPPKASDLAPGAVAGEAGRHPLTV